MNHRYRIYYEKTESMRYTGNLDIHKAWERTFRRAKLPLAYSQGFHPQPKIQLACPLPLGFLSENEILDFYITEELSLDSILDLLNGKLPLGLKIVEIKIILNNEPTLPVQTISTRYRIELLDEVNVENLSIGLEELNKKEIIIRKRRGKEYDLRPLIEEISMVTGNKKPVILVKLSALQGATGRPEEVLSELNIDPSTARIIREKTFLQLN
jgi:radical SAM-linked protein